MGWGISLRAEHLKQPIMSLLEKMKLIKPRTATIPDNAPLSFYDVTECLNDGTKLSFAQFKGKVVYGVNTGSQ